MGTALETVVRWQPVEELANGEFFDSGCYRIERVAGNAEEREVFFNSPLAPPSSRSSRARLACGFGARRVGCFE